MIVVAAIVALLFAMYQLYMVSNVKISQTGMSLSSSMDYASSEGDFGSGTNSQKVQLVDSKSAEDGDVDDGHHGKEDPIVEMKRIYALIQDGAKAFLSAEYKLCGIFIVIFGVIVLIFTSHKKAEDGSDVDTWDFGFGSLTALSFVIGCVTSMASGYIGMMVAVYANVRTTVSAMGQNGWTESFNTAFRAGGVMGFSLCGLALLVLYITIEICKSAYPDVSNEEDFNKKYVAFKELFECVAGFGLGGSSIAMFGRVGGGIYTKAADVGADLAGKVVHGIPEDDPRNPAVIADNVGDNVGDVAGMGSDLFGSFGEATCAAMVISSSTPDFVADGFNAVLFPMYVSALGVLVCMFTSFVATDVWPVKKDEDVEKVLKVQLGVSTLLMTIFLYPLCLFLPNEATFECRLTEAGAITCFYHVTYVQAKAFLCICMGLWGGCIIGFITEYYTSHSYKPVRTVAQSTETGAATNIIMGLALGYHSAIAPATIIAFVVFVAFSVLGMYGISLSALGMLATLATCLSIDVFGPVCDNAGGIAEMAGCHEDVRAKTDSLDAAGNTTAAIGKGFAIGSAALVSLALFGAFTTKTNWLDEYGVNILRPVAFMFLIIGAMLPYWFTAMTMKSVGKAAGAMVEEVKRQFEANPDLLTGRNGVKPDYARCIDISTKASLREMIAPGILVMLSPIVTGTFFGVEAVCGLLAGALVSGVQMAISQSNTGGAWDNAKKYIEKGELIVDGNDGPRRVKKGSEEHKAAVVGDTVGDPLKDTSGPALNILMKLMAIISLVFSGFFLAINEGRGAFDVESWEQFHRDHVSQPVNFTVA